MKTTDRNTKQKPCVVRKKIGGWAEMDFDRELLHDGIRWLRVKDGMGGRGDREDWVADVPGLTVCVSDYQWKKPFWGQERYKSMAGAMATRLRLGMDRLEERARDADKELRRLRKHLKEARGLWRRPAQVGW